ncbi:glycosyl transferase, group 2 family protein [Rhodopirellula maiorica SM1]|uniref:Glycosyl transferase, group 2 family protein n=1 Tax=Rhodopirellula maiorica SM1 TaxID=1265738 RepID=M5RRF5_9BACT|nr:glycosyltransferase family 2 protein [Rhodopirellula maiorica]EMI21865.1 glycosyl transferase, group 2 family protein [Rhodopirellula maiorica SM1]
MKISVITAVYNRAPTIAATIESVASQIATDHEHIVVDGMSTDGTADVIAANMSNIAKTIREPDEGIYDALNKGIRAATGDVVGFLHADDMFYSHDALQHVADIFARENVDAIYGDLVYVDAATPNRVIRYWKSGQFNTGRFRRGWMPPHPTVYVRKSIYEKFGMYLTTFGSAADYECMVRLMYHHQIRVGYIPEILVKMRVGGESNATLKNRITANRDDRRAWTVNGLRPPWGLRLTKPLSKLPQFLMPKRFIPEHVPLNPRFNNENGF